VTGVFSLQSKKQIPILHLVLPEGRAGTSETLHWIADNLGQETHVSLMSQYFPVHNALTVQGMNRKITSQEYDRAVSDLEDAGLENGWVQEQDDV
jgi:putative pyruvate formate lyase activating enzyme